jgi:hypothetical protein
MGCQRSLGTEENHHCCGANVLLLVGRGLASLWTFMPKLRVCGRLRLDASFILYQSSGIIEIALTMIIDWHSKSAQFLSTL